MQPTDPDHVNGVQRRVATEEHVADIDGVRTVVAEPGQLVPLAYEHLVPDDKTEPVAPDGTRSTTGRRVAAAEASSPGSDVASVGGSVAVSAERVRELLDDAERDRDAAQERADELERERDSTQGRVDELETERESLRARVAELETAAAAGEQPELEPAAGDGGAPKPARSTTRKK